MADDQNTTPDPKAADTNNPPADPKPSRGHSDSKPADPPAAPLVVESESQRASRALAHAADEAAERQADTMDVNPRARVDGKPMESGGIFIVDGERVDANGKPVTFSSKRASD